MTTSITCPISSERIDERVVRLVAVSTLLITAFAVWQQITLLFILLATDFAIRAFGWFGGKSPLRLFSKYITTQFNITPQLIDAAPKKFAAGIGFIFCSLISAAFFLGFDFVAYILSSILLFCASLEAFFGICVGCYVYSFLQKILK